MLQSHYNHGTIVLQSGCNRVPTMVLSCYKYIALILQPYDNHSIHHNVITLRSYCSYFTIALQSNCNRSAINAPIILQAVNQSKATNTFQSYCNHIAIIQQHLAITLQSQCTHMAIISQSYCNHIANILQSHCKQIAIMLQSYGNHIAATSDAILAPRLCNGFAPFELQDITISLPRCGLTYNTRLLNWHFCARRWDIFAIQGRFA